MAVVLSPILQEAQFDSTTGEFLSGGTITWYLNNTSNLQSIYTDVDGFIPHTNPIVLNARGEPPSQIWLTDGVVYKAVLKDANGSVITTYTDIIGVGTSSVTQQEWQSTSIVPVFVGATSFTVTGDNTSLLHAGRRLKLTVTAGVAYATIRTSTYSAPDTTIVVYNDDIALDAGLSAFQYSVLAATNPAIPGNLNAQMGNVFRRNLFDNGDFDIWWHGTSFSVEGITADRWRLIETGAAASPVTDKVAFGPGSVQINEGPWQPENYIQIDISAGAAAGDFHRFNQRIENVYTLNGQDAVITFWGRVAAGTANLTVELTQDFGTGGAPSAGVTGIGVYQHTLTTTWQKFVSPVYIPSISGKTLGTDLNSALVCNFWLEAGTNFDARTDSIGHQTAIFRLARFQMEYGTIPSMFDKRGIYEETIACGRFFRKSFPANVAPAEGAGATGSLRGIATIAGANMNYFQDIRFDPPMIRAGVLTFYNHTGPGAEARNDTDGVDCTGTSGTATSDSLKWQCTGNVANSVGDRIGVHYTIDAEL